MKHNPIAKLSFASLALLGLSLGSAQAATMNWIGGATGDWQDATWRDPAVPEDRALVDGDTVRPLAVATITYSAATGTHSYGTLWQDTGAAHATHIQTGGDLTLASLYVNQLKSNTTAPAYTISGGKLTVNNFIQTWSNSDSIGSTFLQTGGEVVVNSTLSMAIKSSTQVAVYELQDGIFTAGTVLMGNGSANSVTEFTQSAGTATINSYLRLGSHAGTTGSSIYNLDGGTLTIKHATDPFLFTQPGAPVYFDFNGGTLNLRGTWDFASLTAIANSDFRVAGVPVADGTLAFDPVTIDTEAYTQITVNTASTPLLLSVVSSGTDLTFSWNSKAGKVYDLLSATDLTTAPATWTPWQSDIAATPETNVETFARPGDPVRFFVLVERDAPPILEENFDGSDGGFTIAVPNKGTGTEWAWGVPNSPDQGGGAVTADNGGSGSCWGTNLTGGYAAGTDASLPDPGPTAGDP